MKAASKIVMTLLSATIISLAVLLVGVRLFGLAPYTVLSSSMEPALPVGSLIYVKDVAADDIKVGDAITFVMNEDLLVATHRVVEVDSTQERFITKGDANESIDGAPVHFRNLLGRVSFSIPYLGYVANFINSSSGRWIAIAVIALLLLLLLLPDLFTAEKTVEKKKLTERTEDTDSNSEALRATLSKEKEEDSVSRSTTNSY